MVPSLHCHNSVLARMREGLTKSDHTTLAPLQCTQAQTPNVCRSVTCTNLMWADLEAILSGLQYLMTPLMYPVNHSTVLHCMTLRGAGNGLYTALFLRCIEGHHLCDVEIS